MKMLRVSLFLVLVLSASLVCSSNVDELIHRISVCHLAVDKGNCNMKIHRWYYSAKRKRCVQFFYTGCGGNGNLFFSKVECEDYCQIVRNLIRVSGQAL